MRVIRNQVNSLNRQLKDAKDNGLEKERAIQVQQDEITAIQLELHKMDEQTRHLTAENARLVERWLKDKNEQAQKMNETLPKSPMYVKLKLLPINIHEVVSLIIFFSPSPSPSRSTKSISELRLEPNKILCTLPTIVRKSIIVHEGPISHLTCSKSGAYFASASEDRSVKVFSTKSGKFK